MSRASKSYLKTTAASLAGGGAAAVVAAVGLRWLPLALGVGVAVAAALVVLAALVIAAGGVVVMYRGVRAARGKPDLFFVLNRAREPRAIQARGMSRRTRRTPIRRWIARYALGHDFLVGDVLAVKSWPEIRATLDEHGCLDGLPFMPEMLHACNQRAVVFRCAHRIFDHRKTRLMRHLHDGVLLAAEVCDGSSHGGCDAACHTIWKSAWLRRISGRSDAALRGPGAQLGGDDTSFLRFGTTPPRFVCQLTQLQAASRPVSRWDPVNFVRPLVAGNVTLSAFLVAWLTFLFNRLQYRRGGAPFPMLDDPTRPTSDLEQRALRPGDPVVVRSSGEIRATLNDRQMHRGMWFEPDMMKHCGQPRVVAAEIRKLIDIVTGEMRTMKTPAYVLQDVHFSGERQLFNSQYEPLFWRSAWLRGD